MGVSLKLVEEDAYGNIKNTVWLLTENPSSVTDTVSTSSFDLGYADVNAAAYGLTEGDGMIDLTRFHGASTVTANVQLMGPNKVYIMDQLRAMCQPRKRPWLYVSRPEWGQIRRAQLRNNSFSFVSDKSAANIWKVALGWSNPSGEWESTEISSIQVSPGVGDGTTDPDPDNGGGDGGTTGVGYGSNSYGTGNYGSSPAPVSMSLMGRLMAAMPAQEPVPVLRGAGESSGSTGTITFGYGRGSYGSLDYGSDSGGHNGEGGGGGTAVVYGNVPVLPQIKITGPCKSPQITFNSIGTSFYLKGLELALGEYLLIDVPSRQILLNGDFNTSRYSYLSLSTTDGWNGWGYLGEGANDIDFVTETHGDGCTATLTWRDRWS